MRRTDPTPRGPSEQVAGVESASPAVEITFAVVDALEV
jgi:hypothetical protein